MHLSHYFLSKYDNVFQHVLPNYYSVQVMTAAYSIKTSFIISWEFCQPRPGHNLLQSPHSLHTCAYPLHTICSSHARAFYYLSSKLLLHFVYNNNITATLLHSMVCFDTMNQQIITYQQQSCIYSF